MVIRFDRVSVAYGAASAPALQEVTLDIRPGDIVGVLGRSGAGKSTLVRCVNGLVLPTKGEVRVNGVSLTSLPSRQLRNARSRIGMVFQQFSLVPRLSALTNVLLGALGQRSGWRNAIAYFDAEERSRALAALAAVELDGFGQRRVEALSGGQQQRVAIARALVQRPVVLLADEPVSSLDPMTSRDIMSLLARIHREHEQRITVVNLHDPGLALAFCNRIIGLRAGRVCFDGPAERVTEETLEAIYSAAGGIVRGCTPPTA